MFPNVLDSEKFEKLLTWLNPDREMAGEKYESIRTKLIRVFNARGCYRSDELADETIERVTRKIDGLFATYEGEPALYFYAVAKNVFLEYTRVPQSAELTDNFTVAENDPDDHDETDYDCLEECLNNLPGDQRRFIVDFYRHTKTAKIEKRKQMAVEMGVSPQTLRVRVFRIREGLRKCISTCLERCAA